MKNDVLNGAYALSFAAILQMSAAGFAAEDHSNHNHNHHHPNHAELTLQGDEHGMHGHHGNHHNHDSLAPISIMGDHTHDQGEWMVSYKFMRMDMGGNRNGTNSLSPEEISGDFVNTTGVGPATLRIVPTDMTMDMHMLGVMGAPTDWLTVMVMGHYIDKEMDHITFSGMNADQRIGEFTTKSSGIGDTKLAGLFDIFQHGAHNVVFKAGLSLPTGDIKERDTILNPMNVLQEIRLPYAMQLGSGTYDFEPAITYSAQENRFGWGAQYRGTIRMNENSQDYSLGDKHVLTAWGAYRWSDGLSSSLRVSGETEGEIDGRDTQISGPVQTANPDNYGGERIELGLGVNWSGHGALNAGHTLGAEILVPVYQDLNGPQMARDYTLSLRYQIRF